MKKILLSIMASCMLLGAVAQDKAYNFTNKVTFTKSGSGSISRFVAMLPLPQSNQYQDIANLTYSDGEKITEGRYGNDVLVVDRSSFPGSQYVVSTNFDVHPIPVRVDVSQISIQPYDPDSEPCQRHLGDRGEYIVTSNPYIVQTGDILWQQSTDVLDYARRCYEYVASNFSYINGSWRTLNQILSAGGGECGDFSTLVVNLLRYKGIPSRHNICLRLDGGYHVWVDFYVEGYGWIPLDATYKNSNPSGDYFGVYDGACVIVAQDFCYDISEEFPVDILQAYCYWFWYVNGQCDITGSHEFLNNGRAMSINAPSLSNDSILYNLEGHKLSRMQRGINVIRKSNGTTRKVLVK